MGGGGKERSLFGVVGQTEWWYNCSMTDFGRGPTLKEASPHLCDEQTRIERILTVTETDSVIEGLPPFREETRRHIRALLTQLAEPSPGHAE